MAWIAHRKPADQAVNLDILQASVLSESSNNLKNGEGT